MTSPPTASFRLALTLFAGFALGMHVAVLLHEVGHALGLWASGHHVEAIRMFAPIPAGEVVPRVGNRAYAWGGVVFGTLTAFLLWGVSWLTLRWPALTFQVRMAAALGFLHNAVYLVVGGIVPFGDATYMILLGAPPAMLTLLGLPLLVLQVLVLTPAIRLVGLPAKGSFVKWLAIVYAGLLSLPALSVAAMLFSPGQSSNRLPMLGLFCCFAGCFTAATWRAWRQARASSDSTPPQLPQRWSLTMAYFAAAMIFILVEWLAFHPR